MLELLKELCALDGVSSCENDVRDFIFNKIKGYADDVKIDALGNLIVFKRGEKATGNQLLLSAHMDEVGIIVTNITERGLLKFDFVGGVDRRVAIGKSVSIGSKHIPGVIGTKGIHLVGQDERKTVPQLDNLYIDIGATDKKMAESMVELGDCGAFVCTPDVFGNNLFKAKAIDDRIGCAVLISLLQEKLPLDVTFAFTVQEEVGTRGAFGTAFSVCPKIALVLEGTTAADIPSVKKQHCRVCAPGCGPVISYLDGGTAYDIDLFKQLRDLADENNIPWQTKKYLSGGNDSSAIQRSKAGVRVAAISAAVRYLHAPVSVGCVDDFDNMLKLSRLFLNKMACQLDEKE